MLACVCCLFSLAHAQQDGSVPPVVEAGFRGEHPQAKQPKWHAEGRDYLATFTTSRQRQTALFSSAGAMIASAKAIKFTRQLPAAVTMAFHKSIYHQWYVQSIVRVDGTDQRSFYGLVLNNGNLLDGDHHESFLEHHTLYVSDSGGLFVPPVRLRPLVCR